MLKPVKQILFLFFIFLFTFCGIIRHDVPIQKYRDLAQQKKIDCVGSVLLKNQPTASCVLVSPGVVLSAAHVFFTSRQTFDTAKSGSGAQILLPNHPGKV